MTSRLTVPVLTLLMIGSTSFVLASGQNQGTPPPPQNQNQYPANGNQNQYPANQNQYPGNNQNQYPSNGNQPQNGSYGQNGGYGQNGRDGQHGWDSPPQEYSDVQRQGFHEGMRAARQDIQSQQQSSPRQHMEFRHPNVPPEARDQYREAFRKGYFMTMHHMHDQGGDHGGPDGPR